MLPNRESRTAVIGAIASAQGQSCPHCRAPLTPGAGHHPQSGYPAPVGWVVRDRCIRLEYEIGRFDWHDWERAVHLLGLSVVITRHGPLPPELLHGDTIIVRHGFDARLTAFLVWHAIGHHVLHAGVQAAWASMDSGSLLVAKQERQANEFASYFPVWSIE